MHVARRFDQYQKSLDRVITSPANEKLKLVRKLQSESWRRKLGLFVAEGEDLVEAAHGGRRRARRAARRGRDVAPELLASVSDLPHPPRVVAVYRRADLPGNTLLLGVALWRVVDPGNVGADRADGRARSEPR